MPLSPHAPRQAPECPDPGHISVRSRKLLKAEKRRFYICSLFAEICPDAISTYNTAGQEKCHRLGLISSARSVYHREHHLISVVGVFDFPDFIWIAENTFAIQNSRHLIQGK